MDRPVEDGSFDAASAEAVFRASPLPMTVLRQRADGRVEVLAVNPVGAVVTGWDPETVRGRTLEELYPPDHAERTRGFVTSLAGPGDTVDYRVEAEVPSGRRVYEVRMVRVGDRDGRPTVVSMSRDVTRREAAEEALEETQRLGRIGHFSWNVETGEITWTRQMYDLFGFPPDEPVTLERSLDHVEDPGPLRASFEDVLAHGGSYEVEITIVRPDGERRIAVARGRGVPGREGDVVRVSGTTLDVTDQRTAEADAASLARARSKQAQALELNDDVLQGLATVRIALMQEEHELAMEVLDRTLEAARDIISDLLRDQLDTGPIAGDLVRGASSGREASA